MIKCSNCGSNNQEDIKICLTCGYLLKSDDILIEDQLHYKLDFDQPANLSNQIRDYFFKIMRIRIETELDPKGYRKYFDHFHSSGLYKKFEIRAQQLAEEVVMIHEQKSPLGFQEINHLLNRALEGFMDYFIIDYCESLHKMKLPEAILRYENIQKASVDLGQLIFDFLYFENERDKVYTDFLIIPSGKLTNANEAFLFTEKDEKLFFICDQTMFGSCKKGFAMTDKAIYWKAHFNEPEKVKFEALESIKREGEWLLINDRFFNVNKTLNYKMLLLLKKLKKLYN